MRDKVTRDYKVFPEPEAEYGGYVVVCPSLRETYSQGKTVSEALANIRKAIELMLEDIKSCGNATVGRTDVIVVCVTLTK